MNSQDFHAPLWSERHPGTAHFEPLFAYEHLPPHLQVISEPFANLGPELSAGLRKLVEAKDCMVRQAVLARKERG